MLNWLWNKYQIELLQGGFKESLLQIKKLKKQDEKVFLQYLEEYKKLK
jgi:hypothetical protein